MYQTLASIGQTRFIFGPPALPAFDSGGPKGLLPGFFREWCAGDVYRRQRASKDLALVRVRIGGDQFVFRLYFVDAPESDERFPERNEEQAQYSGITPAESLAAGKAAAKFVRENLAGKPLTIRTRWASALGSSKLPRYYALVEVARWGLAGMALS